MKTLDECKDEVAKKYGYDGFYRISRHLLEEYDRIASELYASQYKQRVEELEREKEEIREWLESYKKSNALFVIANTDQKFEIKRLEKEIQELRKEIPLK